MYKTFAILILLHWSCNGHCATGGGDGELQWFQIELLIFVNEGSAPDSEFWPLVDIQYPATMVTIGPNRDELLQPENLSQLNDIIEYQKLIESTAAAQSIPVTNGKDEFLFDNKRTPIRRSRSSTLDEEDLMSGLNPDISEFEPESSVPPNIEPDQSSSNHAAAEETATQLREFFDSQSIVDAYRALPEKALTLRTVNRRLERSPNYRVLYHVGWRQPIVAVGQAIPILVQAGDRFDDYFELDGTVTISLARYLRLDTDLWFTRFRPRYSSNLNPAGTQGSRAFSTADEKLMSQYPELYRFESRKNSQLPERTYRLVQSRRMRTTKLYYVDHPAFGLMVKVTDFKFEDDGFGE